MAESAIEALFKMMPEICKAREREGQFNLRPSLPFDFRLWETNRTIILKVLPKSREYLVPFCGLSRSFILSSR